MLLVKYFLFVGGALLALLFVSDACLPPMPLPAGSASDLPMIRIQSERKWPERVVFDTRVPVMTVAAANSQVAVQAGNSGEGAGAVREAFAQLPDAARTAEPRQLEASLASPPLPKPRLKKIAKKRGGPAMVLVAQQPPFGWLGNNTW